MNKEMKDPKQDPKTATNGKASLASARKELRREMQKQSKDSAPAEVQLSLPDNIFSVLLAAGAPMSLRQLNELFADKFKQEEIKNALLELTKKYKEGALVLKKTASGYRFHIGGTYAARMRHMEEDAPPRYSNALMETLAVIAYKQPITKSEIEEVRGVTLGGNIMRTLQEHEWIKIIGHKQVPGRPAIWGTTKTFLDSFNLENLSQLPPLPKQSAGKDAEFDMADKAEQTGGAGNGDAPAASSGGEDSEDIDA